MIRGDGFATHRAGLHIDNTPESRYLEQIPVAAPMHPHLSQPIHSGVLSPRRVVGLDCDPRAAQPGVMKTVVPSSSRGAAPVVRPGRFPTFSVCASLRLDPCAYCRTWKMMVRKGCCHSFDFDLQLAGISGFCGCCDRVCGGACCCGALRRCKAVMATKGHCTIMWTLLVGVSASNFSDGIQIQS